MKVARVEEWIEGHEARCEERLSGLNGKIDEIKDVIALARNGVWVAGVGLLAWCALQLYNHLDERAPPATAPAALHAPAQP